MRFFCVTDHHVQWTGTLWNPPILLTEKHQMSRQGFSLAWYSWRVKEAIQIRLHPNNINRDSGIEIPGACMNTILKHRERTNQRAGRAANQINQSRRWPLNEKMYIISASRSLPHRLMKTLGSFQRQEWWDNRSPLHGIWIPRLTDYLSWGEHSHLGLVPRNLISANPGLNF